MRCLDNEGSDNWPRSLLNVRVEKPKSSGTTFLVGTEAFELKESVAIRFVLRMDNRNRTNNRPLRDAMEEQYIGWIIGLERVTSVFRLIQTMLVLLEWLLPLLEDVRLSANQRDIIAMFRDHLRDLETEMQRQICEMRDHILGRYRRSLQG